MLWTGLVYAQKTIQVSTTLSGANNYGYVARDKINFTPGAKYKPNSSGLILNAKIDEKLVETAVIATSLPQTIRATLNTDLEVGSTAGTATVSLSGQAQYTIPIFTPPGTAGMQPQISIQYSSQNGTGELGYGWNIGGLSTITRSVQNIYFDSKAEGITFTNSDAFLYDGQRIISTNSGTNGADNTEYGTESESFVKIISHGVAGGAGSGPAWFEVKTKDGNILEFGNTTDSKFTGLNGAILTWRINKITDANGNYITFTYLSETDEQVISKISYTGNATAGLSPYNSIEFYYDRNPDVATKYLGGRKQVTSLLLRKIKSFADGNVAKTYEFSYGKELYTKLIEIQESGSAGEKYNSTQINWGTTISTTENAELISPGTINTLETAPPIVIGELDGDGRSDMIFWDQPYSPTSYMQWTSVVGALSSLDNPSYGLNSKMPPSLSLLDFEGNDGLEEIYRLDYSTTNGYHFTKAPINTTNELTNWYLLSLGAGVIYENLTLVPLNYKGDGSANAIIVLRTTQRSGGQFRHSIAKIISAPGTIIPSSTYLGAETNASGYGKTLKFADLNGDGKVEIIEIVQSNPQVLNVYSYSNTTSQYELISPTGSLGFWDYTELGDFNGDGNTDILQHGADVSGGTKKWRVFQYTGTGWVKSNDISQVDAAMGSSLQVYINDMDRDGKSDIVYIPSNNNFTILKSNGADFVTYNVSITGLDAGAVPCFVDYDGNGLTDLYVNMHYPGSPTAMQYYFVKFKQGEFGNFVSTVTDGYNNVSKFDYWATNSYSYSPFAYLNRGNPNPSFGTSAPIFQATNMYKYSPSLTNYYERNEFSYGNSVMNNKGKGFLGFKNVSKKTTWTGETNVVEMNYYNFELDATYAFLYPTSQGMYHILGYQNNQDVSSVTFDQYDFATGVAGAKRYWHRLLKQTENDFLKSLGTLTEYLQYDAYGNVLQYKKTNSGTGAIPVTTTLQYTTSGSFCPNKPSSQTTQYSTGTEVGAIRTTNFTYDTKGNMLTKVEDPTLPKALTTTYEYNGFGMPTKQTQSASGETGRIIRFEYDTKGRFTLNTYNALNQKTERTFEPIFGNVLTVKDVDGKTISYQYNGLGRLLNSTDKFGTITTFTRQWESSSSTQSVYFERVSNPLTTDVTSWYDNLSRKIKASTFTANLDELFITYTVTNRFLVTQETKPYTLAQGPTQYITYSFDEFKRPTSVNDNGKVTNIEYLTNGRAVKTTRVSPQGSAMNLVTTQNINDEGQVYSVDDNAGTVSYSYWTNGLLKNVNAIGATSSLEYDEYGRQKKLTEADAGIIQYVYNAFGDLIKQTDADGNTTDMLYNNAAMLTQKTTNNAAQTQQVVTTYSYYTSGGGINKPSSVTNPSVTCTYSYTALGQLASQQETVNSQSFTTTYAYNSSGQNTSVTYPSGLVIKKFYNTNGNVYQLKQVNSAGLESILWLANAYNAIGQLTQSLLGSASLKYEYGYDANNQLSEISLKNNVNSYTYRHQYSFDYTTGNLSSRKDVLSSLTETFTYDNLDRLLTSQVNNDASRTLTLTFANNGNVQSKSNVSASPYVYNTAPPHAVASVPSPLITVPSFTQTYTYNVAKRATNITQGADVMNFTYGPDDQRRMMEYKNSGVTQSTRYYSGNYEKEVTSSGTKEYHYIYSPYGMVAMIVRSSGSDITYFTCVDHQGTINALASTTGSIVEKYNTDAWGARRDPATWWYYTGTMPTTLTTRCYTGHEHLDKFGLINMNARMYDPVIARMTAVDNELQDASYSQNFNRYSYVYNNPMKYTDPTGNKVYMQRGTFSTVESFKRFSPADFTNPGDLESTLMGKWSGGGSMGFSDQDKADLRAMVSRGNPNQDPDLMGTWYKKEADAYKTLMLNSSNGIEQSAFITTDGVYVLPSSKNDNSTASWGNYGYSLSANGNRFTLTQNGKVVSENVIAFIHTHTDKLLCAGPSPEDIRTSFVNGGIPMIVMSHDGKVYGGWGSAPPPNTAYGSSLNSIDFGGTTNKMLMNGSVGLIKYFSNFKR